jgi:hypothetical protein
MTPAMNTSYPDISTKENHAKTAPRGVTNSCVVAHSRCRRSVPSHHATRALSFRALELPCFGDVGTRKKTWRGIRFGIKL